MSSKYKKMYISQIDESDCGVASLAMILRYYGSEVSLAYLRNLAKTNIEGTTAFGIINAAQKLGLETQAIKADMTLFDMQDVTYPFIVHVVKEKTILHYYVVLKATSDHIIIADPDPEKGIVKLRYADFEAEWTGVTLFMKPGSKYSPIKETKSNLLSLFPRTFKNIKLIISIVIVAMLTTIISILGSYFFQVLIDNYIPNGMEQMLDIVVMGLIVAYVCNSIFVYSRDFLLAILGQKLSTDIILEYIKHIFELPLEFFSTRKTGEIVSRFTDASKIIDALASMVVSIGLDASIVIIIGVTLFFQSIRLFVITLTALPIYIIVIMTFAKKFEKLNKHQMESNAILSSSVIEDIQGIETIKACNSETVRFNIVSEQFFDYLNKSLSYIKIDSLQQALKIFIQQSLNVIILWIGAKLVIQNQLSVGQLLTFVALVSYFIDPLQNIINLQPKLQSAKVAYTRMNEVYLVKSEFRDENFNYTTQKLLGDITLSGIKYQYGYGKNVLNNVSTTIKVGEKLAIVGMSGSGKSTLVKMLVKFFDPTSGELEFNGYPSNSISKSSLRSYINYVPQIPYIFSGTIEENLKLGGREGVTLKDINRACEVAMIKNDIENMPLGLNTKLDENASILSEGQKQRITIARALLSPAKVLIFDESTSSLDTITEKKIIEQLIGMKDKTIIFVVHRLSIAKKAARILVLDSGEIVEEGSHSELLAKKGYYYKLLKA